MNGVWRCGCGAGIEVFVDGVSINLRELTIEDAIEYGQKLQAHAEQADNVVPFPTPKTDEEFARECGIKLEESEK